MAHLQLTHAPILNSSAQLLILPVNNAELEKSIALDWSSDILPLVAHHLEDLPNLRIDIHLPKDINI